ncbi:MAG: low molecular weight protein arginine phosphatase [Longimicrobiales bacterium]
MTFEPESSRREDARPTTYNLLFVCTGNTCRSPLAAAIARHAVAQRAWTHVRVQSAGSATVTGAPASQGALLVAREHGLDLDAHSSQTLTPELVAWADLVLGMGPSHLSDVAEMGGGEKSALVTDFLDAGAVGSAIVDPFGGDIDNYRDTYQQLTRAVTGLLSRLEPILAP